MSQFNLASWALRHKSIIYYCIAMFLTVGLFSFMKMGRMEDPSFTIRTMVVGASWPGATPKEMSESVTDVLEETLRDLPDLDYTKSLTDGNKTVIYVNLKETTPDAVVRDRWVEARHMLESKWSSLPKGVRGPLINDRFDDVYGTIFALTGDGYSMEEKRQYAELVKRTLLQVPHVKRIDLKGVQEQRVWIEFDQSKLASYRVSSQAILQALQQQSAMAPAGAIQTDTNQVYLRVNSLFDEMQDIESMPLTINGQVVRLGDMGTVRKGYVEPSSPLFYFNGEEGIGLAISMEDGANNIEFGKDLAKAVEGLETQLPVGLDLHQVSNQPKVVETSISEFTGSLFEAIIIVLGVSFLSLGVRSGVVVALTIPVVVATTFTGMFMDGIDLHKVSLGALIISLGLLVDDAIIVVEMMIVKLEEGYNRFDAATAAYKATAIPMLSGTLITCAGFLPIALSEGLVAEFTQSLFVVVSLALIISWVASILVTPVLGHAIIQVDHEKKKGKKEEIEELFYHKFEALLAWALRHRKMILSLTGGLFLVSILMAPLMKKEFFPASTRPELILNMQFPQSSSLAYTKEQANILSNVLNSDERVDHYAAYVGEGSPRFVLPLDPEIARQNFMQFVITTKSPEDRNSLYKDLSTSLGDMFPAGLPNMSFIQTGPPSKYPIMLRVTGPEAEQVKAIAYDVKAVMESTPDVTNVSMDWPQSTPAIQVHIDPTKARLLGLDSYSISLDLQSKLTGMKVGEFYEGNQTIPITYRLGDDVIHHMNVLQSLPIQTNQGTYVPLSQIATIELTEEDGIIWHRNMAPTITVHGSVPPWVLANSKTEQIYKDLASLRESLPPGYEIQLDGSTEKSKVAMEFLKVPMPIMLIVIMTILMFQLKKIPLMVMALSMAPLGLIGVVLTMLLTGTPIGFMAILGIIALSGMIIRNAIILLDQIELHREEGQSIYDAVISSTSMRFRPIMLTAMAAVLGMIPLMSSAFWSPLAIAFSGGLLVATILTLIVLPVMYAVYYKA